MGVITHQRWFAFQKCKNCWVFLGFLQSAMLSLLSLADANNYHYDSLSRLTNIIYATGASASIAYDEAGNRTNLTSFNPLTISPISNRSAVSGVSTTAIPFNVNNPNVFPESLIVRGRSSNPFLIPKSALTFGGTGSSRTLRITPISGRTGHATITVIVTDGSVGSATSFLLSVTSSTNQPPDVVDGSDNPTPQKVVPTISWSGFDPTPLTYGERLTVVRHFNAMLTVSNAQIFPLVDFAGKATSTGTGLLRYTATAVGPGSVPIAMGPDTTTLLDVETYLLSVKFIPDTVTQQNLAMAEMTNTIVIARAALTVITKNQSKAYLEPLPSAIPEVGKTLEIRGFRNNDNETTAGIVPALELDYGILTGQSDVGTYVIRSKGGQNTRNYRMVRADEGRLSVTPISPNATWPDPVDAPTPGQFKSVVYGTTLGVAQQGVLNSPNLLGLVDYFWINSESHNAEVPYSHALLPFSDGALHTLVADYRVQKAGLPDQNYLVQRLIKTIKVDPKPLVILPPIGKSSIYGDAIQQSVVANVPNGTFVVDDGVRFSGLIGNENIDLRVLSKILFLLKYYKISP